MSEELHWEDVEDSESDSDSTISTYSNETPSEYEPEPQFVLSGDGIDGIFHVHAWEEDRDTQVPITTAYITVHHIQKMRDWWTRKIVEDVILSRTDRLPGKTNDAIHCYIWKFQLQGCSPRDPNRWQLVCSETNETIWQNDRVVGEIKCEVCYQGAYRGRCMVFLYLKSDSYQGGYNHIVGQYSRYLTHQELDSLHVIEN